MKKSRIFILAVIFIIILIAIAIVLIKPKMSTVSKSDPIKQVENKLKNIDAEKLQNAIIEELEASTLNVNVKNNLGEITTEFDTGTKFKGYICAKIDYIQKGKVTASVEIPCFKINSDSDGKFRNIEYSFEFMNSGIINNVVRKVFENNYGLKNFDAIIGSEKYERKFVGEGKSGDIYYSEDEFFINVISEIRGPIRINGHEYVFNSGNCQTIIDMYKEYKTSTFGLISGSVE